MRVVTAPRGATAGSVPAYRSRSEIDADGDAEEELLEGAVDAPEPVGAGALHAASRSAATASIPAVVEDLMRTSLAHDPRPVLAEPWSLPGLPGLA